MRKLNLGFDFGSTYSLIGVLEPDKGGLHCISFNQQDVYFPSVVAYDPKNKSYKFGKAAKGLMGSKKNRVFTAFKTLLNSADDEAIVIERGYDSTFTPELISKEFIKQQLTSAMKKYDAEYIDNLCICIPEVWGKSFRMSDTNHSVSCAIGKRHIEDILSSLSFVKESTIVTEPQAASAFFVHNYNMLKKADLNGDLLIVDYGGGTLDITLSSVSAANDGSDMTIKVIDSRGAGENYNGKVGNAGILYIESLLKLSMKNAGIENVTMNASFAALTSKVEEALRNNAEEVREIFGEYDPTVRDQFVQLGEVCFADELEYCDDSGERTDFEITYADLYTAYNENIFPTLNDLLDRMISDNGVDILSETFKLGLVGGFCNFYLVEKQIYDKFKISSGKDPRVAGLLTDPEDKEKAISLGAALIANKQVCLVDTAEFALGVYAKIDDKLFYNYGIWYRQEIKYNQVYYIRDKSGNKYMIRSVNGDLDKLLIKCCPDDKYAFDMKPKEQFRRKLQNVITGPTKTAFVGFSITPEEKICIHIQECDMARNAIGEPKVIELTDFDNMFDPTVLA